MNPQQTYGGGFLKLRDDFAEIAISSARPDSNDLLSRLVERAGQLAWMSASKGLFGTELAREVESALRLWDDICMNKEHVLRSFVFSTTYEWSKAKPRAKTKNLPVSAKTTRQGFGDVSVVEYKPEDQAGSTTPVTAQDRLRFLKNATPVEQQRMWKPDFIEKAQTCFWPIVVVPWLFKNHPDEFSGELGLLVDDLLFTSQFADPKWPDRIFDRFDFQEQVVRFNRQERAANIGRRAQLYSDASRILALKLGSGTDVSECGTAPREEVLQSEAARIAFKELEGIVETESAAKSRITRAVRSRRIRSRKDGNNLYLELDSLRAYLLQVRDEYLKMEDERTVRDREKSRH